MESIQVELPRARRRFQTGAWGLIVIVWILQTSLRWEDGTWARAGSVAVLLLTITMFVAIWRIRSFRADAEGLHRSLLHGRRRIPWRDIDEVRPAPGRPDLLVFRGPRGRTLAEGEMPMQEDLEQLQTWHRYAFDRPR
ncbi:hypothetical protein ACI3EY_13735 [Ornithinimicrobium sp. LYQ92]|uniref:hypothetical protein n=1 Tax=Serinicoccus sp. LYQ92 TaxID=3378798 RepID=UPI003852F28E